MNPFASLIKSRKFWLLVMDTVLSLVLFFGAKYLAPAAFDDVKFVIASIQPVFVVIIGAIAYEDGKAAENSVTFELPGREDK
jgi:hypothetical protein